MEIELLQSALRYVSAMVTTFLGVLALMTSPRDEQTGKLTSHGRWLLFGITLTGLLSIALQVADDIKSRHQQQAENAKGERAAANASDLREQITRASYPLREPVVTYLIWVEENNIPITPYLRRLDAVAERNRNRSLIKWQGICRGDPTYPNPETESEIYRAAQLSDIRLDVYRRPVHFANFAAYVQRSTDLRESAIAPDLTFLLKPGAEGDYSDCFKLASDGEHDARLTLHGVASVTSRSSTISNGTVTSLVDLKAGQLFVTLLSDASDTAEIKLGSCRINFGPVGTLTLKPEMLRLHRMPHMNAHVVYEHRFQSSFDKVLDFMQFSGRE